MKNQVRVVLALALAAAWLVLVGPAASADAYPPTTCATISVSTTHPTVGETITVTGKNYGAHQHLTIVLHSKTIVLGHATTSADGSFTAHVTLPAGVAGHHVIDTVGGSPTCPPDAIQIVVSGAGGSSAPATGTNGGGGTAFTGVDIAALLGAAAVLLAAGVLLNKRGRRHAHGRHN